MQISPLLAGLFQDAAGAPQHPQPLERALAEYRRHRGERYAGLVGPLVVAAAHLESTETDTSGVDLTVQLSARDLPRYLGLLPAQVTSTLQIDLENSPVDALPELPAPAFVRVGNDHVRRQVEELARLGLGVHLDLPTHAEDGNGLLVDAISSCVRLGVPFTVSGLTQAVRSYRGADVDQHGYLNVLLATAVSQLTGSATALRLTLENQDGAQLASGLNQLSTAEVDRLRAVLRGFIVPSLVTPLIELQQLVLLR